MELPECPNHRKGHGCPRSEPVILREGSGWYSFGCRACGTAYVVTLPEGKRRAAYENEVEQLKRHVSVKSR